MPKKKNNKQRVRRLLQFSQGIIRGEDGSHLVAKYQDVLDQVTPHDMIAMEEQQLKMGITFRQIKGKIEKVMNVIYDQLKKYNWEKPTTGHALYYLMQENRELEKVLKKLKSALIERDYQQTKKLTESLDQMEKHYLRKENILFPFLEKIWENCRPLSVMWSIHDDIRMKRKELINLLLEKQEFNSEIFKLIGELFFLMYGMILKEELVIYPVAMETLTAMDWKKIQAQSFEVGFAFIHQPEKDDVPSSFPQNEASSIFQTETGSLDHKQLELILNTLPLDLSFIDENDEVRYFSNPKDRFFPRSPAVIGRKVQKCHPPESVHIVEKILNSFKAGDRDQADFHIQMKGKFIRIRYFAVRDIKRKYLGTLEVSQDITEIRKLQGEKRLLDRD